jgi:hypothetical protein
VLTSAALLVASLTQTAFVTECCNVAGDRQAIPGSVVLLIGWGACLMALTCWRGRSLSLHGCSRSANGVLPRLAAAVGGMLLLRAMMIRDANVF